MEAIAENISDRELIVNYKSGEKAAFEILVKRYYPKAFALALCWIHNRDAALDVSQEVFVRVYRNIHKFDASKPFAAWMYVITRNVCMNYLKRHRSRWTVFTDVEPTVKNLQTLLPEQEPADKFLEDNEQTGMLWEAINKLPDADREIIILKDIEEFSYKEISAALEIPAGSVMSRLFYARKKLSVLVNKTFEQSDE